MLLSLPASLAAQVQEDTLTLRANHIIIFQDSVFVAEKDTLISIPDTLGYEIKMSPRHKSEVFYDSLKSRAYENKITKELYQLLIRPQAKVNNTEELGVPSQDLYLKEKRKIIRDIQVLRVPVIEGDVRDTTYLEAQTTVGKLLDGLHVYTHRSLIKRNLLFAEGDSVKPYDIADSERIIRSLSHIEDARIFLREDPARPDSVTAIVVVKDRFSWTFDVSFVNVGNFSTRLTNFNILGTGNQLSAQYLFKDKTEIRHGYNLNFRSQNIGNSFTRVDITAAKNHQQELYQFRIFKDFVSPQIKYGGDLSLGIYSDDLLRVTEDSTFLQPASRYYHDMWLGRSFSVSQQDQRKQLILGFRFLTNDYLERPSVAPDSNEFFFNRNVALASAMLLRLNFVKATNILAFGITEDVPVGYFYNVLYGREHNEFERRNIFGGRIGFSAYSQTRGFLALIGQFETYNHRFDYENTLFKFQLNYFTPQIPFGRTNVRNFFDFHYHRGYNVNPPQLIGIGQDIRGLNQQQLGGHVTLSGRLESVAFLPTYFYGFRFAPFGFVDYGWVSSHRQGEQPLGTIGLGVRMRNESLVFRTFELSLIYVPDQILWKRDLVVNFSVSTPILLSSFIPYRPNLLLE